MNRPTRPTLLALVAALIVAALWAAVFGMFWLAPVAGSVTP